MQPINIEAIQLGETLHVKKFLEKFKIKIEAKDPTIIKWQKDSYVVLFRYGVVVLWNFSPQDRKKFITKLRPFITKPLETPLTEIATWSKRQKMKVLDGNIHSTSLRTADRQLIAVSLARTVILDLYEQKVDELLIKFSTIIEQFKQSGRTNISSKKLLRLAGAAIVMNNQTVSQMAMLDKPDFTWDDPYLDNLFTELEEEYEISERYSILTRKLETLLHDSEFIMNFIETRRSNFLEMIIILLFIIDIILIIFENAH